MRPEDFDFELPEEQIAQAPLAERDGSRLLLLPRDGSALRHVGFRSLAEELRAGDLLVVNNARVIPARLLGHKVGTGGKAELLLMHPSAAQSTEVALEQGAESVEWVCLGQSSKGFRPGAELAFGEALRATVVASVGGGEYRVRFQGRAGVGLLALLEEAGRLPLPPYISRAPEPTDAERYQTVYARHRGSVAAPTAGLHFTPELLGVLDAKGVRRAELTLDVGPGTFLPVREGELSAHKMHSERYVVPEALVRAVEETKAAGGRVVAVGTTVVRTLEAATDPETGRLRVGEGETALFITPGFRFRQVDALVTNFHLPRSTLLMLVSAFAGRERVLGAYREAVSRGYRFFSYGDAMFIS